MEGDNRKKERRARREEKAKDGGGNLAPLSFLEVGAYVCLQLDFMKVGSLERT